MMKLLKLLSLILIILFPGECVSIMEEKEKQSESKNKSMLSVFLFDFQLHSMPILLAVSWICIVRQRRNCSFWMRFDDDDDRKTTIFSSFFFQQFFASLQPYPSLPSPFPETLSTISGLIRDVTVFLEKFSFGFSFSVFRFNTELFKIPKNRLPLLAIVITKNVFLFVASIFFLSLANTCLCLRNLPLRTLELSHF